MTEWKEYKLGDVCSRLSSGKGIKSDFITTQGKYPVWGGNGVRGYTNTSNFSGRCCIIGRQGAYCGNVHFFDGDAYMTEHAVVAVGNELADSYFLACQLSLMHLENLSAQSAQPGISVKTLSNQIVSLPPLETQRRISAILSSLDDKIDLLHRENATLEAMAETLFRQWFVEEAKDDWEEGKLGDFVVETVGGEWGKENAEGDFIKPVQCIRGTDIADLNVGLATKTPIRFVKESKFEKIEPRNGDIIMEISGGTENQSTGRVAYINKDVKVLFDYPIVFSNFCRLLRVKEEYTYFVYCYMKYLYGQDEFFNLENGSSGIKNLDYKALLYELTYPMPTHKQQILDFNDKVSVYFEKINRNKLQIKTLIQTRDELLPRLMSNEINI